MKTNLFLFAFVAATFRSPAADLDYYRDVYPFLKANCISCHNKTTTKAGLNMETPELMLKGGENGPGIIPGKSGESLVVLASMHKKDMEMPPPKNKSGAHDLTPAELATLRLWIDQGAKSSVQEEREVVWQPLAPGVHPIYTVAMTKDGRLAACGRSNHISVYDLATRQFITEVVDSSQKTGSAHRALVQALAFSPDGNRLASGSFREVKIWKRDQPKPLARKADAALGALVSVVSADGKQIVSADKTGALIVVDAASGKVVKKIADANKSGIKLITVSPDGLSAAVYGTDAALGIWNLKEGKSLASKPGLAGVRAIAWTADAKSIITAGDDKVVRFSSATDLAPGKELKGATGAILALATGATGDKLVAATEDGKTWVWNVNDGKILQTVVTPGVQSIAVSRDGKLLAVGGSDGAVRTWDLGTGKQLAELRSTIASTQQMAALDYTIAAQTLEQTFQKAEVTRIEAQNKALDELLKKANDAIVTMGKALPEKKKAVTPAQTAKTEAQKALDGIVAQIAKVPGGKPDAALTKQHVDAQNALATATMTATSAEAAAAAVESNIKDAETDLKRINDAKAKNAKDIAAANAAADAAKKTQDKATADLAAAKTALTKASGKVGAVAFSADGQQIAGVMSDGSLKVWAVSSGVPTEQVAGAGTSLAALANGTFIACAANGAAVGTSPAAKWSLERTLGAKGRSLFADRVNAVRFSPDGKTLATGGGEPSRSGDIILFDVASGKAVKTWKDRHDDAVLCLDFSPDGKRLASGGSDKIARVTDVATGKQVNLFEGHTHHVMGIAFRADGRVLATAGADNVVISWDMIIGERKKKIEGWTKEVTSLQFIGATSQIVTSAGDNLIRIVNDDGTEVRAIAKLPDFMQSAASTPSGTTIIGGGEDSFLRVWDGSNGKELVAFGAK